MGIGAKEMFAIAACMNALKKLPQNPPPMEIRECPTNPQNPQGCYSLEISLQPATVEALLDQIPFPMIERMGPLCPQLLKMAQARMGRVS